MKAYGGVLLGLEYLDGLIQIRVISLLELHYHSYLSTHFVGWTQRNCPHRAIPVLSPVFSVFQKGASDSRPPMALPSWPSSILTCPAQNRP